MFSGSPQVADIVRSAGSLRTAKDRCIYAALGFCTVIVEWWSPGMLWCTESLPPRSI